MLGILWETELAKILVIAVIAASPVGEILIAIPVGVALGVDPLVSYITALPFNMAPSALILLTLDVFEKKYPSISRYFARRGEGLVKRLGVRKVQAAMVIITPIAGVYAVSFSTEILGIDGRSSFAYQSIGVALYGLVEALLIYQGLSLPGRPF